MRAKLYAAATGSILLLTLVGCGSDRRAAVSGKVTVAGKGPLTGGSIQFVSASDPKRSSSGQIKPDGTYEIPDAPVGECKVVIDNTHLDLSSKKMKGGPTAPVVGPKGMTNPTASGPKASDTAKMTEAPKGADIPPEMSEDKPDLRGLKFMRIDASFTKADTTPLKATVAASGETHDFEVK